MWRTSTKQDPANGNTQRSIKNTAIFLTPPGSSLFPTFFPHLSSLLSSLVSPPYSLPSFLLPTLFPRLSSLLSSIISPPYSLPSSLLPSLFPRLSSLRSSLVSPPYSLPSSLLPTLFPRLSSLLSSHCCMVLQRAMRSLLSATPSGGGAKYKKLSQRLRAFKEVLIRPATLA